MTGKELKIARIRLDLTQAGLADLLGISTRTIHTLENTDQRLEKKYTQLIHRSLQLVPKDLSFRRKSLVLSDAVSWPGDAYLNLARSVGRRIRHIQCEVVISPNRTAPKSLADVNYRVSYRGIELAEGHTLVIDHLGNPRGPDGEPSRLLITEPPREGPFKQLRAAEDDKAADYATIYEIGPATSGRRIADMSIGMICQGGVNCNPYGNFDSIGFPLYADMVLDVLEVAVAFEELNPEGLRPTATLLRRAAPRYGLTFAGDILACEPEVSGNRYHFGVIRPRGGFYYGLGFERLRSTSNSTASAPY